MASRRALSLSTTLFRHHRHYRNLITAAKTLSSYFPSAAIYPPQALRRHIHATPFAAKQFDEMGKIDPNEILFEGCDYKHWLIVMDFPSNPVERPPAEEMVATYVQTLAKVIGSEEEAKKRMYACSTTTYTGFQAEMDEETSKKFEDMPGVLFVLPDSYIDPVNKEYGGDKYINGTIIPRPPPVQYGRVSRGNRNNNRRPRDHMPNQGNPSYNQQSSDGRSYMPQQRFPQQQGGLSQQGFEPQKGFQSQQGFPSQQGFQSQQGFPSQQGRPQQQGFPSQQAFQSQQGFPSQQGHPQQQDFLQQRGVPVQQNYCPPGQGMRENYMPSGTLHPTGENGTYTGGRSNDIPSHQEIYNQGYNNPRGQMSNHPGDHMHYAPQGQTRFSGDNRNYNPHPGRGPIGKSGVGSFDQDRAEQYATPPTGTNDRVAGSGYVANGGNQTFVQRDEPSNTMSAEQRNHSPAAQSGRNQER